MRHLLVAAFAAALFTAPAIAADPVADPASPVGAVGKVIVDTAAGRSYEQAYATTKNDYNPFGISKEALLAASGTTSISEDGTGAAVKSGELSILPQFNTPGGKFSAGAGTPPTIPFAFLKGGKCQAGYVAGFPSPTTTYAVDLKGAPCSVYSVDDLNFTAYTAYENGPHDLSDKELEQIVRAAYTAAAAHSAASGNYFARDGAFAPLHDAVAAELARQHFDTVAVPSEPSADLNAARVCLGSPGVELRIAVNAYGDGVSLVAVSSSRVFSYHYDPHETSEIVVAAAEDCPKG